ncbi:hypothetical protein F383_26750 [Gossypium arboreum]|uniref:Uncharacterized protein n=1 Tax=Gossypium arboreum TaxID=29729 RepID=A0A0B0P9T4_GOSAR|nr:hypothetical protein F383_26750 [Gossypium arboreum]
MDQIEKITGISHVRGLRGCRPRFTQFIRPGR